MEYFLRILLFLSTAKVIVALEIKQLNLFDGSKANYLFYSNLLKTLHYERPFHNLLIVQQNYTHKDLRLEILFHLPQPKVLLTGTNSLIYKMHFNIEMLTVAIMYENFDGEMFRSLAETLAYIRQSRIMVIAVNVTQVDKLKEELLQYANIYKMTSVLMHFLQLNGEILQQYHILHPYPQYHWCVTDISETNSSTVTKYFPIHWHNLKNITLYTWIDQEPPRTYIYEDAQGKHHLSGTVPKLVMLFAEQYNASLKMYRPLKVGSGPHFIEVNKLVVENKLDIPMVMETTRDDRWQNMTDAYGISEIVLMVPRPKPFATKEIFAHIFNGYFLKTFVALSLAFSIIYSGAIHFIYGISHRLDFILSSTAVSGTLGLSFPVRVTSYTTLRIIYFLIGLVGIILSSMFAGSLNTYFTSPPYHRQINTFYDLVQSKLKILITRNGANLMGDWFEDNNVPPDSLVFSTNGTFIRETRNKFNTSFAYYIFSPAWRMMQRQQYFHSEKYFFTPPAMRFYSFMPWGILLPFNSPYKDAMNYLIHRVHSFGLMQAWEQQVFADLLKLKQISIRDPNQPFDRKVFSANDFFWVWIILLLGLMISFTMCLLEIIWFKVGSILEKRKSTRN